LYAGSSLVYADFLLRGGAVALLTMLALVIWKDRRQAPAMWFGLALAVGMIVYVIQTAPFFQSLAHRFLEIALVALSNGNNPLFWFFALALFDDEFRVRLWQLLIWVAVVCFAAFTLASHDPSNTFNPMGVHGWSHRILAWLPMVFGGLTIVATVQHWRADLIEQRRWLRAFIVVAGFLYMLGTGLARLDISDGRFAAASSVLDILVLSIIVFVIASRLLALDGGEMFPIALPEPVVVNQDLEPARLPKPFTQEREIEQESLAKSLEKLIAGDLIFREENLTINRLATKLGVPEYRLRRVINQRLGHRNFNAFLNTHRLQHVVTAMADPSRTHLPILTLALDAGFQSIGPFNRAFKSQFGVTPTVFREKYSADSGIG
jgi:AraC-like DNA-binding protein